LSLIVIFVINVAGLVSVDVEEFFIVLFNLLLQLLLIKDLLLLLLHNGLALNSLLLFLSFVLFEEVSSLLLHHLIPLFLRHIQGSSGVLVYQAGVGDHAVIEDAAASP